MILRTVDDVGVDNKLGNHRFLRFTPTASGQVTVTLVTSNPTNDPDFQMCRAGTLVLIDAKPTRRAPRSATSRVTAGTTYVLDVYDCDNGCSAPQGSSGDYDLTVTIN